LDNTLKDAELEQFELYFTKTFPVLLLLPYLKYVHVISKTEAKTFFETISYFIVIKTLLKVSIFRNFINCPFEYSFP